MSGPLIREVVFESPVPKTFREAFLLRPGDPLLRFSTRRWERRLLSEFPSLAQVRVRRGWDRTVRVTATPRRALARIPASAALPPQASRPLAEAGGGTWRGVDADGCFFPLSDAGEGLPLFDGPAEPEAAARALRFLAALTAAKERWTDGLNKIKMSSDGEMVLTLAGGAPVYWGPPDAENAVTAAKARRLARVLNAPEGAAGYAYIRFVDDRWVVAKPMETPPVPAPRGKEKRAKARPHHRP